MKNYTGRFFVAALSFGLLSCQSSSTTPAQKEQDSSTTTTTAKKQEAQPAVQAQSNSNADEATVMQRIKELPEYQEAAHTIDSVTNGKHGISTMVEKPEKGKTDYQVTIGYNSPERFETYGVYYVNPKTGQVKLYDDMSGEIITIEAWRSRVGD